MYLDRFLFLIILRNVSIIVGDTQKIIYVKVSNTGTMKRDFLKTFQKLDGLLLVVVAPYGAILD